ncbi:MAG: hypothetical protein Q8P49_00650 [Candidatus Liptonbacteria bacterium]|nr:hypothetical protein [Candidatus Liptonbacteria bacterium]
MKKNGFVPLVVIVFLGLLVVFIFPPVKTVARQFDPMNATYTIGNMRVALENGSAQIEAAPGSASKIVTRVFGGLAVGDINGDHIPDAAFILAQDLGGSGTFYYTVAALNTIRGAKGTNAILLGDRIAPKSLEIRNGKVIVNYAQRRWGEPMTAGPSVETSKHMIVRGSTLETYAAD